MAASAAVVLGLPGDLVDRAEAIDHTATKAGGKPLLPSRCNASALPELHCGVCSNPLSLVFQAYAPLDASVSGRQLNDRVLYVFGCVAEGCGVQSGCWRAIRLQEAPQEDDSHANIVDAEPAASVEAVTEPEAPKDDWGMGTGATGSDWGMGGGSGWGFAGADGAAGDPFESNVNAGGAFSAATPGNAAFSFGDLDAALDGLAADASATAAATGGKRPTKSGGPSNGGPGHGEDCAAVVRNPAAGCFGAELPEFHIYAAEEQQHREDRHLGAVPKEHAERLLAQYQEAGEEMPDVAPEDGGAAEGGKDGDGAQQPAESWAGEEYEDDHTAAIDAAGMKFLQRVQRCPEQCARYCFGGAVLWPSESRPAPKPCIACGAPRIPELQLMGPLVHFLEEGSEWLKASGSDPGQAAAPPSSWCWATVAVYSCSRSCGASSGGTYDVSEEWVSVIND